MVEQQIESWEQIEKNIKEIAEQLGKDMTQFEAQKAIRETEHMSLFMILKIYDMTFNELKIQIFGRNHEYINCLYYTAEDVKDAYKRACEKAGKKLTAFEYDKYKEEKDPTHHLMSTRVGFVYLRDNYEILNTPEEKTKWKKLKWKEDFCKDCLNLKDCPQIVDNCEYYCG